MENARRCYNYLTNTVTNVTVLAERYGTTFTGIADNISANGFEWPAPKTIATATAATSTTTNKDCHDGRTIIRQLFSVNAHASPPPLHLIYMRTRMLARWHIGPGQKCSRRERVKLAGFSCMRACSRVYAGVMLWCRRCLCVQAGAPITGGGVRFWGMRTKNTERCLCSHLGPRQMLLPPRAR